MRILVIDDDKFIADYITDELNKRGHDAKARYNAKSAVQSAESAIFDMMVCDLILPDFNGIQAIRLMREKLPSLPVIVLSSLEPQTWEAKCREAGAACYLHKPVSVEDLLEQIALVEKSLIKLNIGLVDPDADHCERLMGELRAMGCKVHAWKDAGGLTTEAQESGLTLLLIDHTSDDASSLLPWAQFQQIPVVVFGDAGSMREDNMLRTGYSLCVNKPVDGHRLIAQASFLLG